MEKFKIYIHEEAGSCAGDACYELVEDIDSADALVVGEGKEFEEARDTGHAFATVAEAVRSLVLRYVDLVSCSREKSEEARKKGEDRLGQAKNRLGRVEQREKKLIMYAKRYGVKLKPPGKVILAPSCSGKSWFIKNSKGWQDLDDIAGEFKLHGEKYAGMPHTEEEERKHYARIDTWLVSMQRLGFRVLGSLYEDFEADAVVIIDEKRHREYTMKRDDVTWETAKAQRKMLLDLAKKKGIKVYSTIESAVGGVEKD